MSLSTLRMAAGFLQQSQLGVELAGRNIAGAEEPGYSRQRLELSPFQIDQNNKSTFTVGLGARVGGFQRMRDEFLDTAYRANLADNKAASSVDPLLARLESSFNSEDLGQIGAEVRKAMSTAASAPEEPGLLLEVLSKLGQTTDTLNSLSADLDDLRQETVGRQSDSVDRFNEILSELADLNVQLPLGGQTTAQNGLRDQRDTLLDELSGLADVQVKIDSQDRAAVYLDGREVLYNNRRDTLALNGDGDLVDQRGQTLRPRSGELEGLREFRQTTLPDVQNQLDSLAQNLRDELNAAHRGGYASDGVSGRDLLAGTDAGDLKVAINDPSQLAISHSRMESAASLSTSKLSSDQSLASQTFSTTPAGSGVIEINGTPISWDSSQSLDTIATNMRSAGVEATWNPVSQRLLLKRLPDGQPPSDITVSDSSGNLSATLQLTAPSYPGFDGTALQNLSDVMGENRFSGDSFSGRADGILVQVGSNARQSSDASVRTQRLAESALERRDQVSGVSIDEELINLTRYEQAYAAAARLVTAADEMLSTLMSMGAR